MSKIIVLDSWEKPVIEEKGGSIFTIEIDRSKLISSIDLNRFITEVAAETREQALNQISELIEMFKIQPEDIVDYDTTVSFTI